MAHIITWLYRVHLAGARLFNNMLYFYAPVSPGLKDLIEVFSRSCVYKLALQFKMMFILIRTYILTSRCDVNEIKISAVKEHEQVRTQHQLARLE
jgi:hypothetical protein